MSDMKNYMKLDDMETIHFKLNPAQIAALADIYEEGNGIERDELMANNYIGGARSLEIRTRKASFLTHIT